MRVPGLITSQFPHLPLHRRALGLMLAFACTQVGAQSDAEINNQLTMFKAGMQLGCYSAGRQLGHSAERIDALCKCRLKAVEEAMSEEQWKSFGAAMEREDLEQSKRITVGLAIHASKVCGEMGAS